MVQSFLTIGQQILILFILMAVGYVCGKCKIVDQHGSVVISNFLLMVVIPATMIVSFQQELVWEDLRNSGIVLLIAVASILLTILIGYVIFRGDTPRQRLFRFACVFSNCAFIGYPLMESLLGSKGILMGSFYNVVFQISAWTWGVYNMTGDRRQLKLRPLLLNPGIIGVAAGVTLYLLQLRLPDILLTPMTHLYHLNVPLPMIVAGFQLSQADLKISLRDKKSWLACGLRLVVAPLMALGLCLLLRVDRSVAIVVMIAAGAPAAALTSMFSARYGGDTALAGSVVSIQTLLSIVTMPPLIALADFLL